MKSADGFFEIIEGDLSKTLNTNKSCRLAASIGRVPSPDRMTEVYSDRVTPSATIKSIEKTRSKDADSTWFRLFSQTNPETAHDADHKSATFSVILNNFLRLKNSRLLISLLARSISKSGVVRIRNRAERRFPLSRNDSFADLRRFFLLECKDYSLNATWLNGIRCRKETNGKKEMQVWPNGRSPPSQLVFSSLKKSVTSLQYH